MKKSSRVQLCVPTNRHPFIHFGDVHPFAIPQCDMMRVSVCILKGLKVWHPKGSNMESCWPCWLIAFQSLWHNRYIHIYNIQYIYILYNRHMCWYIQLLLHLIWVVFILICSRLEMTCLPNFMNQYKHMMFGGKPHKLNVHSKQTLGFL